MILTGCRGPLEGLIVPQQVLLETDFDNILTLKLQHPEGYVPSVDQVRVVLKNTEQLYAALALLGGNPEFPPLRILYVDSGTTIRFDLKGLGDPIKRIKELLSEGWTLIRHRKVEDFRQSNVALFEGLGTIREISGMKERGELSPEDASRLSQQILGSVSALLEAGVLPREVLKTEVIENERLLNEFQRKLLPPAPEEGGNKKQRQKRRSSTRRRR